MMFITKLVMPPPAQGRGSAQGAQTVEQGEGTVFGGFHQLALAGTLVIDATEVEDAMNDDTVELIVVGLAEELGIGAHGVEADDDVAVDDVVFIVVESDDIGIKVVTEVLVVDLEYLLVVNKHISHLAHTTSVAGSYGPDPVLSDYYY